MNNARPVLDHATNSHIGAAGRPSSRLECLQHAIEHATHLLPAQGPITVFIHHNTLHAFEDLPFEEAVKQGARTFGCHPFLPEDNYRVCFERGRIRAEDISAVLMDDLDERADVLLGFLGTRYHLRLAMLQYPLRIANSHELRWVVEESDALRRFRRETSFLTKKTVMDETRRWVMRDLRNGRQQPKPSAQDQPIRNTFADFFKLFDKANIEKWSDQTWESFCLHILWQICHKGVEGVQNSISETPHRLRHRDLMLEATGADSDRLVNEVLIRFCAPFVDQGFAHWSLPQRERGFYHSFCNLYRSGLAGSERWLRGLRRELIRLQQTGMSPLESIDESLDLLGVHEAEREAYIAETFLALRGWAGMIWQMETRGDRVAHPVPEGSIVEFLAIRLILDRIAIQFLAKETLGFDGPLSQLRQATAQQISKTEASRVEQRTFLVFQLAQVLGWKLETLYQLVPDQWRSLLDEIESFSGVERRRIYHLAYERRYRIQALDAVAVHSRRARPRAKNCDFQVITCIDEREESFRRHLEKIAPKCETFGAAGFFSVAMYYRGAGDAHFIPLCPVIIKPNHYVQENVVYTLSQSERRRKMTRQALGTVTHRVHVGSRTFAGGWLAAIAGSIASFPLVMRILFPRLTARLRRMFGQLVQTPPITQLVLERATEQPGSGEGEIGYSVKEMAAIVERLLRDIGLTANFARLVIVTGHGSSSLNNPHEAAHDCGACGGARGGPNARAIAQMANDQRVREILAANGLNLSREIVFVGAYHNTCDDSVAYFDLDRLPTSHQKEFDAVRKAMDLAREWNAHERCRRFETAALNLSGEAALRHVEGRAEDLSQTRPEYGHATNALCFVGRRQWSRGLYLDRRAFLQSYDPAQDDGNYSILTRILQAVIPVCAGINLEYYFSFVDPVGFGCGTKLPHNITSLLGVMDGAASDLRTGLPWQMVEIHEPVRLLFLIEARPEALLHVLKNNPGIDRLVRGRWVQLALFDPATARISVFQNGQFEIYKPESAELPIVQSSVDWYRGWRDHLGFASVVETAEENTNGKLDSENSAESILQKVKA